MRPSLPFSDLFFVHRKKLILTLADSWTLVVYWLLNHWCILLPRPIPSHPKKVLYLIWLTLFTVWWRCANSPSAIWRRDGAWRRNWKWAVCSNCLWRRHLASVQSSCAHWIWWLFIGVTALSEIIIDTSNYEKRCFKFHFLRIAGYSFPFAEYFTILMLLRSPLPGNFGTLWPIGNCLVKKIAAHLPGSKGFILVSEISSRLLLVTTLCFVRTTDRKRIKMCCNVCLQWNMKGRRISSRSFLIGKTTKSRINSSSALDSGSSLWVY